MAPSHQGWRLGTREAEDGCVTGAGEGALGLVAPLAFSGSHQGPASGPEGAGELFPGQSDRPRGGRGAFVRW